jgi:hypothetical protein
MASEPFAAAMFRTLLERPGITIAPGAPDPLTALIAHQTGFELLHCTGGGIARSFGLPDVGYLTLSELVGRVASMTEVCSLPMIVDVDSGHGTALNVQRAVKAPLTHVDYQTPATISTTVSHWRVDREAPDRSSPIDYQRQKSLNRSGDNSVYRTVC